MKKYTSAELRRTWIKFYEERGHKDCGAVSLVSDGSTGVMFNVAGMQPLMPYLLGRKHPLGTRLCNVQGCVRTIDIDSVGDKSHGTFFEMMGSWSLGDYFKKERCQWSYELLTQVFGFDSDHLAATVFAGDENAPRDEEGAKFRIESGFKPENIYYLPKEDNWWGLEYGPCGPDSEMFYVDDRQPCGPDCKPGCHCGKYTEIGNDVFMQYEKHKDGHLTPLSQKNVDTGWGLDRILAFLNGLDDVYQTDLHVPSIAEIEKASGISYGSDEKSTRSMRILADHTRTAVMLIGDEKRLLPSNAGAGYVLRRLIRRAVRHARLLKLGKEDILRIAGKYVEVYGEGYPLLVKNREFILTELGNEIDRFTATIENGMKEFRIRLEETRKAGKTTLDGEDAFFLYDTYGFPLELTVELAEEEGLKVDEEGFNKAMERQKQMARENKAFSAKLSAGADVFDNLDASVTTQFVGYDRLETDGHVSALAASDSLKEELSEGEEGVILTDITPFYGTMGGQVGDSGTISAADGSAVFEVSEAVHVAGGRTAHVGKMVKGTVKKGDAVMLKVDEARRLSTCRNHSATHLLQKALREVLGDHVEQSGSYQDTERTRFDFSHGKALTAEELEKVEQEVNARISGAYPVDTKVMSLEEAKKTGAMALFGEKYGSEVRVVTMGDSVELCGGTHVDNTSRIGDFKIVSESSVAAGIRRIEALTGENARKYYSEMEHTLREAAVLLKTTPADLSSQIKRLQEELKNTRSELESLKAARAKAALGDAASESKEINGVKYIAKALKDVDMNGLRDLGDELKTKLQEGVVLLISEAAGKVSLMAMATDGAVAKGAHAGNLVKAIAPLVGGGGGGKPSMAQAGGKNPAGIPQAISEVEKALAAQLKN